LKGSVCVLILFMRKLFGGGRRGLMGKGKGLNPADKARKKDKEREKKRNKEEKVMSKEIASLNDPDKILNELKEIAKVCNCVVVPF
jgi:hypothetical protein